MKPGKPLARKTPLATSSGLERRTALAGGGELARTELHRRTELARSSGPTSRGPTTAQRDSWARWAEIKYDAWVLWGHRCVVHGHLLAWPEVHGHHRKLRSQGGPDTAENCLPVCFWCHARIHRAGVSSYDMGYLVRSWDDPGNVPVVCLDGQWRYL